MGADRPSSKVARLIEQYGLDGVGDELERRWTGDGVDRMSLRDCATLFNERLLEAALLEAGVNTLETDIETTYRRLTDDDISTGVRTDTRRRLERTGVDVDALDGEFVTYQAIRSYLTEYRDAEYERLSDAEKVRKDIESIQRLVSRTRSVTEDRIETLDGTGRIDGDAVDVLVDVQVLCRHCGRQYPVTEFLEQRGCDCRE
jgi:hypothetical protein